VRAAEVVGEGERQPERPRELRGEAAGAEKHDRRRGRGRRRRGEPLGQATLDALVAEEAEQVEQVLREVLGGQRRRVAPQREGRLLIRAGRPADAQVDATGVQGLEEGELLGHHQRGVVGQHHSPGTDANPLGRRRQVRDEHGWVRARHGRHVVVLGHPEAGVAQAVGGAGELAGRGEGVGRRLARAHSG
jgi:hypothetical protein